MAKKCYRLCACAKCNEARMRALHAALEAVGLLTEEIAILQNRGQK